MPIAPRDEPTTALASFGIHAGPRTGEQIPIRSPVVTIGTGGQSDVVLADDSVSKIHARLEYEMGGWRLTDLGSTNGTYVEGVRLAPNVPTPLAYGSSVRLGGMALQFHPVESADPDAARAGFTPPSAPTPLAERRGGFRLPVWVFLLILIVLAVLLLFVLDMSGPAPAGMLDTFDAPALAHAPPGAP